MTASTEVLALLDSASRQIGEARQLLTAPPAPPPVPVPPPSTFAPDIFYGDDFSDFPNAGTEPALFQPRDGSITRVEAPDGSGDMVFKMRCLDTTGTSITENPRDEMLSSVLRPGQEFWRSGAFWLPEGFPSIPSWLNLAQLFAKPWTGSPPVSIKIEGRTLMWMRNAAGNWQKVWTRPVMYGTKVTFLEHIVLPTKYEEPSLVEQWIDGEQVCSGKVAVYYPPTSSGNFHAYIQNYRKKGMFPELTVYHWPMAIGTKRELVER